MKKVLFICCGNICRSVSAEYIMKDLAKKNGVELYVSSACLLYTSPSPRDRTRSRMPSSA